MKKLFILFILSFKLLLCYAQENNAFIGEIKRESFSNETAEKSLFANDEIYWILHCTDGQRRQLIFLKGQKDYTKYKDYLNQKVIVFGEIMEQETAHHKTQELIIVRDICKRENFYSEKYETKNILSIEDCKNIEFIKYIFTAESGINIENKEVKIIKNEYSGGIPVQIEQIPVYYKISISNKEYEDLKKILEKNQNWKLYKNEIVFRLVTKFDLGCKITKNELIFGFRNMKGIHP